MNAAPASVRTRATCPPAFSAKARQMARPKPVPPLAARVVKNASNTRPASLDAMPAPLSSTHSSTLPGGRRTCTSACVAPCSKAFSIKFTTIARSEARGTRALASPSATRTAGPASKRASASTSVTSSLAAARSAWASASKRCASRSRRAMSEARLSTKCRASGGVMSAKWSLNSSTAPRAAAMGVLSSWFTWPTKSRR